MEARVPPFRAAYAPADEDLAARFLSSAPARPEAEARIDARAGALVAAIRAKAGGVGGVGGIEDFLHEFSLSTKEGLALMVLAEALLRVPDNATADDLIEDKLSAGDFADHAVHSSTLLVSASAWALGISARVVASHETPESILHGLVSRLGRPAVRTATRQAMRLMGSHFVLGQTIGEALARGGAHPEFRYSFDMLGEGARTAADAARYFDAYAEAIAAIGAAAGASRLPQRPGISVKLSALHPRYEAISHARVVDGADPAGDRTGTRRQIPRPQPDHRCRGGRPARTVARHRRTHPRRPRPRRLGRLRPRGAGLPEARARGDRLGGGARRRRWDAG